MPTVTQPKRKAIPALQEHPRHSERPVTLEKERKKSSGIHYTPPLLAAYLAKQVVNQLNETKLGSRGLSVLDPACGEGELLKAIVDTVPSAWRPSIRLTGFDMDGAALDRARRLLEKSSVASLELYAEDFLSRIAGMKVSSQLDFLQTSTQQERMYFDAVISNPPYVRTQVLGSASSRELAARFDLTGRVDLYQAFIKAMTLVLREGGILGLLTSNRFLSVQSGSSIRDWLKSQFRLCRLVDLGDTKLFNAAVLPAVVVAERTSNTGAQDCEFIRVYESSEPEIEDVQETRSIFDVLDGSFTGHTRINGACFRVETGRLRTDSNSRTPWTISNRVVDTWLTTVKSHSDCTFADVAKICVGVKTTADSVFIRDDWSSMPDSERPEDELLHPLITHHLAARWHLPTGTAGIKRVLYPYIGDITERLPVDLANFPHARKYLLKHRAQLESRSYVIESGRRWYEIWVPHRPHDWARLKLAFPDISESSRFFLVDPGWIVNGDCYWTKLLPGKDASWLTLMLAVANSSFALKFYDTVFHNKLYSGRRRFMSQYVSRFPLPKLKFAQDILDLMPSVLAAARSEDFSALEKQEQELDALVWRAFGLSKEVAR